MMNTNILKLFVSELRIFPIHEDKAELDSDRLCKAMTANTILNNLGYTLRPEDVVRLSNSPQIDTIVDTFKDICDIVKADPMYPDFPKQVMGMSEAQLRFHQMLHYFSTYGAEMFLGINVDKGWLPDAKKTAKTKADDPLLKAKVITLIDADSIMWYAYGTIMLRRERMTDKEMSIIKYILEDADQNGIDYSGTKVAFKENLMPVFYTILMSNIDPGDKVNALASICQHSGDVLKCTDYALVRNKYHFTTSQKKTIVRTFERFSLSDFKENLCRSFKQSQRAELIMRYIDFTTYCKTSHSQYVGLLRKGKLESWMSRFEESFNLNPVFALDMAQERPGIAVRLLTRFLRAGIDVGTITRALTPCASKMSTQTLLTLANLDEPFASTEKGSLAMIAQTLLIPNLREKDTPLKSKKVFLDLDDYDLDMSKIETNDKSGEGGYIRSGIAYRIPESVKYMRFFLYWNDSKRIDLDLHSFIQCKDGRKLHGGWNGNFYGKSFAFSGDITHSDAAEYIDIDLSDSEADLVATSIHFYNMGDKTGFGDIDECYVGALAVSNLNENVKLYNPKNCFFSHRLTTKGDNIMYAYIDLQHRCIIMVGKGNGGRSGANSLQDMVSEYRPTAHYSLKNYLTTLLAGQHVDIVNNKEDADVVLVMCKPSADNEVSLIDNNFFMD